MQPPLCYGLSSHSLRLLELPALQLIRRTAAELIRIRRDETLGGE